MNPPRTFHLKPRLTEMMEAVTKTAAPDPVLVAHLPEMYYSGVIALVVNLSKAARHPVLFDLMNHEFIHLFDEETQGLNLFPSAPMGRTFTSVWARLEAHRPEVEPLKSEMLCVFMTAGLFGWTKLREAPQDPDTLAGLIKDYCDEILYFHRDNPRTLKVLSTFLPSSVRVKFN